MINEKELAEAVERLREGEAVMGLSYDKVMESVMHNDSFVYEILDDLLNGNLQMGKDEIESLFDRNAESMLRELYRTKLENEAGL
nr:hypothetical protein [Alteromonas macleodii]